MVVPRTPSARLTDCVKPGIAVWRLRCCSFERDSHARAGKLEFQKAKLLQIEKVSTYDQLETGEKQDCVNHAIEPQIGKTSVQENAEPNP